MTEAPWYKNAVFYGVDVKAFRDADGDGIGDFAGLTERLDYLAELGVTCLWVLPFYPSGGRDNGYDVTDHLAIDPRLGTFASFRRLIAEAKERGLRVLIDLVAHHTSDRHPYFEAARSDPASSYRDYYVWAEKIPNGPQAETIFPGVEEGVWHFDELADAYFHHRFYHTQPDLNLNQPKVQKAIFDTVDFWLSFGVSGFRIDAAPHLFESKDLPGTALRDPGAFMNRLRAFVHSRDPEALLLAETDVTPEAVKRYFGRGRRMHMLFNFLLNNQIFLALARGEAGPLEAHLRAQVAPPDNAQWANFLRNLDELDLERLTAAERDEVYRAFAPRQEMRVYGRGVRRRLAPMLGGDVRRLKLALSLLFALPGAPLLVYGDELGMGDDLELPERESVRTPMQWSDSPNGGFSEAKPGSLIRPAVRSGPFSSRRVNVQAARRDPDSLLNTVKKLIAARKRLPEIGSGQYEVVKTGSPQVLGVLYGSAGTGLLTLHNLSDRPQRVAHPCPVSACIIGGNTLPDADELEPYGFAWLRCTPEKG